MKHLVEKQTETHEKVIELHELLLQAKGIRWLAGVMLAVGSFVGGTFGAKIAAWLGGMPRV